MHARSFDKSGKTKYIHIACVIVGIVIPLVPVIALMATHASKVESTAEFISGGLGFGMGRSPPILCVAADSTVSYYSIILPINLIFFVGMTELILLFAIVHKVCKIARLTLHHTLKCWWVRNFTLRVLLLLPWHKLPLSAGSSGGDTSSEACAIAHTVLPPEALLTDKWKRVLYSSSCAWTEQRTRNWYYFRPKMSLLGFH